MDDESMSNTTPGLSKHRVVWAFLVGALLICAPLLFGAVLLRQPQCRLPDHPHIHWMVEKVLELTDKIGDACLIAALIAVVVDTGLKTRLIQEVVQAASPKLIGRHLPPSIHNALLNYFKINFIRPNWEIEYEIVAVEGLPDFVQLNARMKGIVQNCGSGDETFSFVASLDPSPRVDGLGKSQIVRASMAGETNSSVGFDISPDNKELLQPDGTVFFKRDVMVPSRSRHNTVLETVEYRQTSYVMPLFTATTVAQAILRIRYPKQLIDLQVSTGLGPNLKGEHTHWGQEWSIQTPLLPGQSIVAIWNPLAET